MKDAEKDIAAMTAKEEEFDEVVLTDDEGHKYALYEEELFIVGKKTFAVLVGKHEDVRACGEDDCHCHEHGEADEEVIIAKAEFNEAGLPVYVEPTDEEFKQARAAYDALEEE